MLNVAMIHDSVRTETAECPPGPRSSRDALLPTVIGKIVALTAQGRPHVDFAGNPGGPLEARTIVDPPPGMPGEDLILADVLLVFDRQDWRYPVIVGFPRSTFQFTGVPSPVPETTTNAESGSEMRSSHDGELPYISPIQQELAKVSKTNLNVKIDGQRTTLVAEQEIRLSCGKSSMTLRKDGKIVIQGTHLVSRAEGLHRIKGGSVKIN